MTHSFPLRLTVTGVALVLASLGGAAVAATELQGPTPVQPTSSDPAAIPRVAAPAAPRTGEAGAGPRVVLSGVRLEGCAAIACDVLVAAITPLPAQAVGLAEIEQVAQRVADHYKRAGYPFVQVVVPPQQLDGGVLTLQVIEGVLGKATVVGTDPLVPDAQSFLTHGLPRGQIIREADLERTMLLMDDQPGFSVHPVIRPGAERGQGDLQVEVVRQNRVSGEVGVDNIGSRSTGQHRLRAAMAINSPFRFGDRIALNALTTDERMWLGSVDYDAPIGPAGWRGQAGVARTSYQLGGAFTALDAKGYADTVTLKLSYPVLRSQQSNVITSAAVLHKGLQDRYDAVQLVRDKSSNQILLAAQFDHRDAWLGGGVTYGQVSMASGSLRMDANSRAVDAQTARSAGSFTKANLDVARIQRLVGPFSAYGRVSMQWASGNLDSSEKYGIGGFLGVRAYPMGEGTGDEGWLSQGELRMSLGQSTVFLFGDAGRMKINARPWDPAAASHRGLAGAGAGLRWGSEGWNVETTLASRVRGGKAQSEQPDQSVRWFLTVSRRFD